MQAFVVAWRLEEFCVNSATKDFKFRGSLSGVVVDILSLWEEKVVGV